MKKNILLVSTLLATCLTSANAALTIDSYTDATNDRFANNSSFVLNGYNLSGIGRDSTGKWSTMVSSNVFVSANHYHPAIGATLYFYENNDPSTTPITRTVTSGTRMQEDGTGNNTDIWAGVLNAPLPPTIAHYTYSTEAIKSNNFLFSSLRNEDGYLIGISPGSVATAPGQDQGVGVNVINGMQKVEFGDTDDDYLLMSYDTSESSIYRTYESSVNGGDSGSPLMILDNGNLLLEGTASFKYSDDNDASIKGSGYTYIGDSKNTLNNYISVNAVPEPSTLTLFALSALVSWKRRRLY